MSFKEQYTTSDKVLEESKIPEKDLPKFTILEKDKIVLSNDAMAIGQLLETLSNKLVR